jgi:hypothetical protein
MATATQKKKVHKVMHEHKKGTLKSGSGKKVRSRKQAVAIAMSEEMTCWPVSTRVGNVRNNDPSLIEPVALAG